MPRHVSWDIAPPRPAEEVLWRHLWGAYLEFYEATVAPARTDRLWALLTDPAEGMQCRLAHLDGQVVGFVHFFSHPDTWYDQPACYLADLYVDASVRGQGIGRALIDAVRDVASTEGWHHVYWHTAADNATARRLYDTVTGGPNGFIAYEVDAAD